MSCHPRVTAWTMIIQTRLPHLRKPQATVLALWSLGMMLARSCALMAGSAFLAACHPPAALVALLDQAPLPLGRFVPKPGPAVPVSEEATPSLPVLALPQAA